MVSLSGYNLLANDLELVDRKPRVLTDNDGNPLYFAQATSDGIPRTDGSGDEFNLNTRDDQGIENNINDSDTGYFPGILKTFGIDITSFFNKKEKIDLSDARKMELLKQIRRDKNQTSYLNKTREN
jgi:hypothetical protein